MSVKYSTARVDSSSAVHMALSDALVAVLVMTVVLLPCLVASVASHSAGGFLGKKDSHGGGFAAGAADRRAPVRMASTHPIWQLEAAVRPGAMTWYRAGRGWADAPGEYEGSSAAALSAYMVGT